MAPKAPPARRASAAVPRRSRFATRTGLVLGSALAALAMYDGVRLRVGSGLPGWLSTFLGGVVVWLIVVALVALITEILRRNRKAIGRSAGRHAGRAGRATRRRASRWRRAAVRRGESWAATRWQARNAPDDVDLGDEGDPDDADADDAPDDDDVLPRPGGRVYPDHPVHGRGPWLVRGRSRSGRHINPLGNGGRGSSEGVVAVYDPAELDRRLQAAAGDPDMDTQVRPMPRADDTDPGWPAWDDGDGPEPAPPARHCVACGNPEGGKWGPLAIYDEPVFGSGNHPRLIHESHFTDEDSGFYGRPRRPAPAPATTTETGGTDMTTGTSTTGGYQPARRARRSANAGDVAVTWKELITGTADFEPEDDAHLMAWMAGEAAGQAAYAEAITDVYETAVNTVGLDPVAMQALHEYAEAAADAAKAMADARARFAAHYQAVREFSAAGGVMPHNGRWITGEGE